MGDSCVEDDLIDEREEFMVPLNGGNRTLRKARFLKPTFTQDHHLDAPPPPPPNILLSSKPTFNELKKSYLKIWKTHPTKKWKIWVHNLKPKYQKVWRKAGVYEAIMASTHKVTRDKDLVICLAEKWCADTNTFVLPWGEVTISLQDVVILGGYSVLGLPFSSPLPAKLLDILNGMKKVNGELKLRYGRSYASSFVWMDFFMCSGKQFEHEAFLAFWLTRFVCTRSGNMMAVQDFELAVHLAGGTRIALAPLVLASIYNDMTQLNKLMLVRPSQLEGIRRVRFVCHIDLVQMWAWERFPQLRPTPAVLKSGEPRAARWSGVMKLMVADVRAALDSAEMSFVWRPYAVISGGSFFDKVYTDKGQWLVLESDADVETESIVRCLRVSELVGSDSIEQYLPHRVARQFGLDQDLPSPVIRSNESHQSAWRNYDRPVRGVKLYIPPGLVESDVSSRYMDWWRGFVSGDKGGNDCIHVQNQVESRDAITSGTPTFPFELVEKRLEDSLTIGQLLTLSRNTVRNKKKRGADDEPVLDIISDRLLPGCSKTTKESKHISKPTELGVTSASSSCKSNRSKSSDGCTKEQEDTAGLNDGNQPEEHNVETQKEEGFDITIEKQLEAEGCAIASKAKCPEADIINIEDDSFDDTALELQHSGLEARLLRLEKIMDAYKAAKFATKS